MKKRVIALAALFCLALALSACGGNTAPSSSAPESEPVSQSESVTQEADAPSESEAQTPEEEPAADASGLPTLEEFMNSDVMQAAVDAAKSQYEGQGVTANLFAVGDELHYEYIMEDVEVTEDQLAEVEEMLASATEEQADNFQGTADQALEAVSNDSVTVVITYKDSAGQVLYTTSYTATAAE